MTTIEKEEISNALKISLATFYNWQKTKPRLIELVKLGLEYEQLLEKNEVFTKEQKEEADKALDSLPLIMEQLQNLSKRIEKLENK